MNLYLVTQDENYGYDTYDSMVVCATSRAEAVKLHPYGDEGYDDERASMYKAWCTSPEDANADLIGIAAHGIKKGVVIASFNAG